MKLKTTLFAAAATLTIAPAAHAYEGVYGAIGAGLSYFGYENDVSNDESGGSGPVVFDSSADYDKGIGIYAALGYAYDSGWRTEVEFSYRNADIDQIDPDGAGFSGLPSGSIGGDTKVYSVLANVLYDFKGLTNGVTPYVGAGVGLAKVDHDIAGTLAGGAPTAPLSIAYGGKQTRFAYQGIAGVAFDLAENLALDISYRYFSVKKGHFPGTMNGTLARIQAGSNSHNVFAGLRWNFGAPPPPPVQYKDCWDGSSIPMTAQCPPQVIEEQETSPDPVDFTVYFDYDKSNLTPQASTLIQEATARALENDVETVVVAGNTDTSGSSAYNQALSERRARVVRDALVANGISADRIRTEAFGETNPAKPTADGVREPLNRRSEVRISFE